MRNSVWVVFVVLAVAVGGSVVFADKETPGQPPAPMPAPDPQPQPDDGVRAVSGSEEPAVMPKGFRLPSLAEFVAESRRVNSASPLGLLLPVDLRMDHAGHIFLRADATVIHPNMVKSESPLVEITCDAGKVHLGLRRVRAKHFWAVREKPFEGGELQVMGKIEE